MRSCCFSAKVSTVKTGSAVNHRILGAVAPLCLEGTKWLDYSSRLVRVNPVSRLVRPKRGGAHEKQHLLVSQHVVYPAALPDPGAGMHCSRRKYWTRHVRSNFGGAGHRLRTAY